MDSFVPWKLRLVDSQDEWRPLATEESVALEQAWSQDNQPNQFRLLGRASVDFLDMRLVWDRAPSETFAINRDAHNHRRRNAETERVGFVPPPNTEADAERRENEFKLEISADPNNATTRVQYAYFLRLRNGPGDWENAEKQLCIGAAADCRHIPVRIALATTLTLRGNYAEARDKLTEALRIDPKSPQAHWEMFELLRKHFDGGPTAAKHYEDAAVCAARDDDTIVMRSFLLSGGSKDAVFASCTGYSLLWVAACNGSVEVAELLVEEYGANVNLVSGNTSSTALHAACYNGYDRIAYLLLHHGARVDVVNTYAETPHDNAVKYKEGVSKGGAQRCAKLIDARLQAPSIPCAH